MRIEYELKFRDYLLFNALHQLLSVPVQVFYGGFALAIFFSYLEDESLCVSSIAALLAYVAAWTTQLVFNVIYLYLGDTRSILTKYVVEIQGDSLYEETQFKRSYHYWPGLTKVIDRPGFIAVYISAHAAHIIPDRAFPSNTNRREFLLALKGKLSAI